MTADGDQTRARLLTEARDLYLEVGLARFSLREVARRSKVSAAAVYRHYEGKEALLREVCGEGFRIFASYLLRALEAPTPRARMERSAEEYLRFAMEQPRHYRFIFMGAGEDTAVLAPSRQGRDHEPTFQFLVDRVHECVAARVLRKGDAQEMAALIWAHVHGLVSLRLSGHLARIGNDAAFERFYKASAERTIDALAP